MSDNSLFPECSNLNDKKINISNNIFGRRFHKDQTLYEYLIEFLLIFVSSKEENSEQGKFEFHDAELSKMEYYADPRMGLKRFIFYDKSKKTDSIPQDKDAYEALRNRLLTQIVYDGADTNTKEEVINCLQDFLYGYPVVIKNRSWCAQGMLPICPELIFCEAMPAKKKRLANVKWTSMPETVDTLFDFTKHNFLARGGELYYLHLVQGLKGKVEDKRKLEFYLKDLLTSQSAKVSTISNFIQNTWYKEINSDELSLRQTCTIGCIPQNGYIPCENKTIQELLCFLSNKLPLVRKLELFAQGIILQIMRMMTTRLSTYLDINQKPWIVDMGCPGNRIIKVMASNSFHEIENDFTTALNKELENYKDLNKGEKYTYFLEGKKESLAIFRAKGKDIKCIIPLKGGFERFSLSEDIVTFLVLSLIRPGTQMTLDMFLDAIYNNYNIVIGINEYTKSVSEQTDLKSVSISFNKNVASFEKFLKATGFLQELSDATSVVVNPYEEIVFNGDAK